MYIQCILFTCELEAFETDGESSIFFDIHTFITSAISVNWNISVDQRYGFESLSCQAINCGLEN